MISSFICQRLNSCADSLVKARAIATNSNLKDIQHSIEILLLEDGYLKSLLFVQQRQYDTVAQGSYIALALNLVGAVVAPLCFPNPTNAIVLFTAIFQALIGLSVYCQHRQLHRAKEKVRSNHQALLVLHRALTILQTSKDKP